LCLTTTKRTLHGGFSRQIYNKNTYLQIFVRCFGLVDFVAALWWLVWWICAGASSIIAGTLVAGRKNDVSFCLFFLIENQTKKTSFRLNFDFQSALNLLALQA
jgi:hypothetical protein